MQSSIQLGWYRKVNVLRKAWAALMSLDSGDLKINKMVHCWFHSFHRICWKKTTFTLTNSIRSSPCVKQEKSYRFRTEFGGENVAYGCEQQCMELLVQALEVAEGEDDHLFGMSVQPLSDLH